MIKIRDGNALIIGLNDEEYGDIADQGNLVIQPEDYQGVTGAIHIIHRQCLEDMAEAIEELTGKTFGLIAPKSVVA